MAKKEGAKPLLLKVAEAAEMLQVSPGTIYGQVASGALPAVRLGRAIRLPVAGLELWISEQSGGE